jgi:hypothetical protein
MESVLDFPFIISHLSLQSPVSFCLLPTAYCLLPHGPLPTVNRPRPLPFR